ncbi:uncharacterized protein N0V89_007511 [Didymosphaeria variabile]|uniref:Uncharacterized protein n=1 Tax=Didymosphaeria variabile TaxID=1932322 RepID=A0A9W9C9J6_9PLEO|nr:uncharacterized protein N0V89_007511 [Didymosphaeria variabile]KAJ4352164.1 hypothetical protein N0V89_007511 [Didymosphaeria variabile]
MTSKLRNASLRETLSIAHTAECKLRLEVDRPDRDLRFMLGHALTLDSVSLRLIEIEREAATVQQPSHASGIKFQAASNGSTTRRTSPPPSRLAEVHASDEDEDEEDNYVSSDDEQDELSLTRFPSGPAKPPQEPPQLVPSEEDSSDEEEPPSPELPSEDVLRNITKGDGNEDLMNAYAGVRRCPCHGHHESAPRISRMWEIPAKEGEQRADGVRIAVAEVAA